MNPFDGECRAKGLEGALVANRLLLHRTSNVDQVGAKQSSPGPGGRCHKASSPRNRRWRVRVRLSVKKVMQRLRRG